MAPLQVTEECMKCHGIQGYKPGEIRGGISVTFDITAIEKNLTYTKYLINSGPIWATNYTQCAVITQLILPQKTRHLFVKI